jgi:hypothetical protein
VEIRSSTHHHSVLSSVWYAADTVWVRPGLSNAEAGDCFCVRQSLIQVARVVPQAIIPSKPGIVESIAVRGPSGLLSVISP